MSVNSAIGQSYLADVEALAHLLQEFIARRQSAPTQSEKVLVEAEAIVLFERMLELDHKLQAVRPGDYPLYEDFQQEYSTYYYLTSINTAKLRKLTELFIRHFNSQQYALTELFGKLKRIRQKRSALALWNGEDAKFILSDHFLNFDWLDNKFTSAANCFVDTSQGILTLPVRDVNPISIKTVSVGSGSNGQSGNSDVQVTTNNINPEFTINGDPNDWFEYERLDSGPLKLSLIVELSKAEIINSLVVTPLNIGQSYTYAIEDILFTNTGEQSTSVKDLMGEASRDRMLVKSAGNDSEWTLTFLPVVAKTITLKFKQSHAHTIEVATVNSGTTIRNRYALGISKLAVNQLRYDSTGGINSIERDLPGGLYSTIPIANVWPPKPELFDASVEVSFNGGESWIHAENVDDSVGQSVVMEGTEKSMIWRLQMDRNDDALDSVTSFIPDSTPIKKIQTLMRAVSRYKSPTRFSLPEKPARGNVFVIQPKVGRRGNRFKRILLGVGSGVATKFELPFSPVSDGIDPESMHVYANGLKYSYIEDNSSLSTEEWSFSDDFSEIELSSSLAENSKVSVVFDEERMLFEQRSDGYYHQMEMLFDPDEENIGITFLPRVAARNTKLLPRDKRIIHLGVTNIDTDSFSLTSSNGTTYSKVTTRTALGSTSDSYMIDGVNGILWLNSALDADTVRAGFDHQAGVGLTVDQFDVVYGTDDVRPWGVRIASDAFQAMEGEDTVGGALSKRINVLSGLFEARTPKVASAADAISLSHDYVVKGSLKVSSDLFDQTYVTDSPQEMDYVDGRTEFLGLIAMDSESTNTVTVDALDEVVSFTVAAGSLLYEGFAIEFSDTSVFGTDVGAATPNASGEYSVSAQGLITVYVGLGGTLAGGIKMYYYYQDPEFEPNNKYSVDYREGVLYGGSDLQTGAKIGYKASGHRVSYNIAKEVDQYSYDQSSNSIAVRTEGLRNINNLVKLIWAEQTQEDSLRAFRDYFSPIIALLAFRFV